MVEPLEETRSEIMFATEPALSSLELAIPDSGQYSSVVELDEIEVLSNLFLTRQPLTISNIDPKRDTPTLQRPFVPPYICQVNTLQHMSREHCDQWCCQSYPTPSKC